MTDRLLNHYSMAIVLEGKGGYDDRIWLNGDGDIVDYPFNYPGEGFNERWEGFRDDKGYDNALRNLQKMADAHGCSAVLVGYSESELKHYDDDGYYAYSEDVGYFAYEIGRAEPSKEGE